MEKNLSRGYKNKFALQDVSLRLFEEFRTNADCTGIYDMGHMVYYRELWITNAAE